ncbi:hypothetical protein JTB14_035684 [Gonioctena quinquepunctata]|nr:hypothetical protein JTB14_035684 [Gonioctena quinquepunctata]
MRVECGNSHLTNECRKSKNTPAKCCNCKGQHTANCRGCTCFPKLQRKTSHRNNNNDDQNQNREKRPVGDGSKRPSTSVKSNTITPDFLNMVPWNANGLISKKDELIDFLIDHNIDIVFLQETHLKNDHVGIPNYEIFRKDRLGGRGGGVTIGVKRNLSVVQADLDSNRLNNTKAIGVEVNTQEGRLRLVSVYNPPPSILSEDALDSLIGEVNTPTRAILLQGTFRGAG